MKWNSESFSIFPFNLEVRSSCIYLYKSFSEEKGSDLRKAYRARIFEESFSDFLFFAHIPVCLI
nr:MAG TPA: hypothetical protein [Caudoviricetes sp.]